MLELFILWKLTRLNYAVEDEPTPGIVWFVLGSLVVTWPVLLYLVMRRRGDSRYMSASVAVGVAAITLAFGLGWYLAMALPAWFYVAWMSPEDDDV